MSTLQQHELITFGSFEVDLQTGEIRKLGMRVRLQGQPFRLLVALVTKPGEIITREELQRQLWGEHTTVDFERGIATAMSKLRDALGDSADHPRYIETLAKRGFRFIAPVTIEPSHERPVMGVTPQAAARAAETQATTVLDQDGRTSSGGLAESGVLDQLPTPVANEVPAVISISPAGAARLTMPWTWAFYVLGALILATLSSFVTWRLTRAPHYLQPSRISQLTQASQIYDGPPNPENLLTLVTDGPRIYTSLLVKGVPEIGSLDTDGSAAEAITMPDELNSVSVADISRNGSRLIVRGRQSRDSEQPLWIVPRDGSSALRIGDVLAHDATFMPDGESILYATGNELDVVQLKSGLSSRYAVLPGRAFWLRWSPSDSSLRFTLIDPVTHISSLWELDASSRRMQALSLPALKDQSVCCGSWSADGRFYVLQATDTRGSDLWALGTGPQPQLTRLTNGPLSYISPLPSRTERTIFFVGLEPPAETRVFDASLRRFVPAPTFLEQARRVSYSRDGRWVAWVDVDGRLWRALRENGSERLQLTPDDLNVFLAQWSPDHSQLVVMARQPGQTWQLYIVSARGGLVRKLLADRRNLADPDWSADGRKLVFGREADLMGKESGPHNIQLFDLKTMRAEVLPGSVDLFSPRWSPDGRCIAALSLDQTRLLLYNVAEHRWSTLFSGSAADPVWSPDSKAVYFHAFADPQSAILRIPVTGGSAERIADMSNLEMPKVDSYFFGGITPAGAPIVKPRIGTGNLFSLSLPD